jgi:magnesium chelatase family protein
MNPCPCEYAGDPVRPCRCTPQQVDQYRGRLSGPLWDRIDLTVDVPALPADVLSSAQASEPSAAVLKRVVAARARQFARYGGPGPGTNAAAAPVAIEHHGRLGAAAARILEGAVRRFGLSARGYAQVRKVALTIADLAGDDVVREDHVAEALQFRPAGR